VTVGIGVVDVSIVVDVSAVVTVVVVLSSFFGIIVVTIHVIFVKL